VVEQINYLGGGGVHGGFKLLGQAPGLHQFVDLVVGLHHGRTGGAEERRVVRLGTDGSGTDVDLRLGRCAGSVLGGAVDTLLAVLGRLHVAEEPKHVRVVVARPVELAQVSKNSN
jgi:hypothetical protein